MQIQHQILHVVLIVFNSEMKDKTASNIPTISPMVSPLTPLKCGQWHQKKSLIKVLVVIVVINHQLQRVIIMNLNVVIVVHGSIVWMILQDSIIAKVFDACFWCNRKGDKELLTDKFLYQCHDCQMIDLCSKCCQSIKTEKRNLLNRKTPTVIARTKKRHELFLVVVFSWIVNGFIKWEFKT